MPDDVVFKHFTFTQTGSTTYIDERRNIGCSLLVRSLVVGVGHGRTAVLGLSVGNLGVVKGVLVYYYWCLKGPEEEEEEEESEVPCQVCLV